MGLEHWSQVRAHNIITGIIPAQEVHLRPESAATADSAQNTRQRMMVPRQDRHDYVLTPAQTWKIGLDVRSNTRRRTLGRAKLAERGGAAAALAGIFLGILVRPPFARLRLRPTTASVTPSRLTVSRLRPGSSAGACPVWSAGVWRTVPGGAVTAPPRRSPLPRQVSAQVWHATAQVCTET